MFFLTVTLGLPTDCHEAQCIMQQPASARVIRSGGHAMAATRTPRLGSLSHGLIASVMLILGSVPALSQEFFKSSKFLEHPAESQKSYITSSVIIASLIAAQNSEQHASCIRGWIDREGRSGYVPVLDAMRKYPDDHPTALVLAVLQKACGPFKYQTK